MRITVDRRPDGFTVEVDRPPMKEAHFRALCGLARVGVCASMVVAIAALCGFLGLIVVGVVAVVVRLIDIGI